MSFYWLGFTLLISMTMARLLIGINFPKQPDCAE